MDNSWDVHQCEMRTIRASDLDAEDVFCESSISTDPHYLLCIFYDAGQVFEVLEVCDALGILVDLFYLFGATGTVWNNFDGEAAGGISTEANLSRKSGANIVGARKGDLSQGLENRALARGLISTDDNLWEGKEGIQTVLSQAGHGIEEKAVSVALEIDCLLLYLQIGL